MKYNFASVLFAADVKIMYNDFKSTMIGTATSRTIFTVDPGIYSYNLLKTICFSNGLSYSAKYSILV